MTASAAGDRITDVVGVTVGHHHRIDADARVAEPGPDGRPGHGWATGITVIRVDAPPTTQTRPVVAVDVRGGGPGTRETDLLDPSNTVQTAHAIVLGGGSAYGLAAADGVMSALEEAGVGLPMDAAGHVVPIVPAAVIFDLPVGDWRSRPDADFGRSAVASAAADFEVGSVGAGAGARAGALKGGVGTASVTIADGPAAGITVGALMVANPVGAVLDPATGLPWGADDDLLDRYRLRRPDATDIARLRDLAAKATVLNTTIGVVATDAGFDQAMTRRVAMAAHDGLGRAVRPAHSPLDGDTIFAVATGARAGQAQAMPAGMYSQAPILAQVCACAADVTARAVIDAVVAASPVAGIPAYTDVAPSVMRTVGRRE
ncbi:P1 family peptidase [Gordonia sp. ABSL1-1]|uniref:P1 family peptidase n=1 Tax=Gordonia sp. ABSL1-1 TaxID=3053923 RepID=UPI0025726C38|nr:P1 family peptidase [Gordonia sp. ABSL1-1]MDL9938777.1 P1 family peptidase [Gordonia sp. ABSL1-1]